MLVLSRKEGERLHITNPETGKTITVIITKIQGEQCRVGIDAPREMVILRDELRLLAHPEDSLPPARPAAS